MNHRTPLHRSDHGFTLIEILVVILIIGVLCAIALPVFLGQQKKGQDAGAKSLARQMVTHVESCYAETEDYGKCLTASDLAQPTAFFGTGVNQVRISSSAKDAYDIRATSAAESDGSRWFGISRDSGGARHRDCAPRGAGSCTATADSAGNRW